MSKRMCEGKKAAELEGKVQGMGEKGLFKAVTLSSI